MCQKNWNTMFMWFMWSGDYNIIPLPYPATWSLLPSPLKPQLYTSSKNLHTCTITTETSIICYKYNYEAEIYFYNIISVKFDDYSIKIDS